MRPRAPCAAVQVCNMNKYLRIPDDGSEYQEWTFSQRSANTACRQLGLPLPGRVLPRGQFGPGLNRTWLNYVSCTGTEAQLDGCKHGLWGNAPLELDIISSNSSGTWRYIRQFKCGPEDAVALECGFTPPASELHMHGVACSPPSPGCRQPA